MQCVETYFWLVVVATRTVTTDKPSDLLVEVNEISFHLHKVCSNAATHSNDCMMTILGLI